MNHIGIPYTTIMRTASPFIEPANATDMVRNGHVGSQKRPISETQDSQKSF